MSNLQLTQIKRLIEYHLGTLDVQENQRLVEDLGAESADIANIVASVEEKYQIRLNETEIANLFTPKDIYDLVKKHLNEP